ncbi:MAG TPA: hypothetical protein VFR48_02500 [Solirubrobacteraceae bacterium]|nr:hypothetical protein [Solirubrobacteraceae bacterium]
MRLRALLAVGLVLAIAPTQASAAASAAHHRRVSTRAPSGPPLSGGGAAVPGEGEQTAGIQSASGDQLVENGLASPLCKGRIASTLSGQAQADCRTSGFVGASAPTNDYALDVHIDTGAFGVSKGGLLSIVQDVLIAPVWGALGWIVHVLLVALEWCYTLELLGGGTSTVASALGRARATFTDPWLAPLLALASLLVLHHGLVHRRVADTLGGALTMLVMMAVGLWVIADPAGTVGTVGAWADQASLGALQATTGAAPTGTAVALGESVRALYASTIETPWCYLEFGNVGWCDDPSRLEPSLRTAALALAAHEGTSTQTRQLVRAADTNGALFLAFPANGPARNSINQEGSLLRAICRSEEATKCKGPAASEAEFRTDGGTFPRMFGLLAILAGIGGLALLFGSITLQLLTAALFSVLILLLAPIAVLAPALGDGGRAIFTGWAMRLLGTVTSRLLFSFLLGALLSMQRIIASLAVLGWWTQWLLFSAMWWMAFLRRHQAAAILREGGARHGGAGGRARPPAGHGAGLRMARLPRPHPIKRAEQALHAYGAIRHPARWVEAQTTAQIARRPPSEERAGKRQGKQRAVASAPAGRPPARGDVGAKSTARLAHEPPVLHTSSPPVSPGSPTPPGSPVSSRSTRRREDLPSPLRADQDSVVMKDAFAVERGEKPKLGFDFKDPQL